MYDNIWQRVIIEVRKKRSENYQEREIDKRKVKKLIVKIRWLNNSLKKYCLIRKRKEVREEYINNLRTDSEDDNRWFFLQMRSLWIFFFKRNESNHTNNEESYHNYLSFYLVLSLILSYMITL